MMKLHCAIPSCGDEDAYTIWRGFALCEACYDLALEFPNSMSMEEIEWEISEQLDTERCEEANSLAE